MGRNARLTVLAALILLGTTAAAPQQAPPQPAQPPHPPQTPRHSEIIEVREAGVLAELPPPQLLDKLKRARRPSDFQVYLDGSPREVVSLEPASSQAWEIVVYLDPALTPAGALNDSVILLGKRAERLMALGPVAVVVADPEPRVALPPTQDFSHWPAALAQVAVSAGVAGGRSPSLAGPRLLDTVRRQCDRLAAFAAQGRSTHPRALLWIGAPDLPISPSETNALTQATDPGREGLPADPKSPPIAAAFARAAQALATNNWVTIPVIPQPPSANPPTLPPPPPGSAALERPRQGPIEGQGGPFSGYREDPKAKARRASDDLKLNAALFPWLAPHHLLARATAGRTIQDEIQLDDTLDSLGRRIWLWYRPPGRRRRPPPLPGGPARRQGERPERRQARPPARRPDRSPGRSPAGRPAPPVAGLGPRLPRALDAIE